MMNILRTLTASLALAVAATAAQAATIQYTVSDADIVVGDVFTVELRTSADTPEFSGFDISYIVDAAILREDTAPEAVDATQYDVTSEREGFVSGAYIFANVSGAQLLATLTFEAMSAGTTLLDLEGPSPIVGLVTGPNDQGRPTPVIPGDDPSGQLSITVRAADVAVVPLPAAGWLLLGALGGLGLSRACRRA